GAVLSFQVDRGRWVFPGEVQVHLRAPLVPGKQLARVAGPVDPGLDSEPAKHLPAKARAPEGGVQEVGQEAAGVKDAQGQGEVARDDVLAGRPDDEWAAQGPGACRLTEAALFAAQFGQHGSTPLAHPSRLLSLEKAGADLESEPLRLLGKSGHELV